VDDCLAQPDGGKDPATRLLNLLLEGALDLLSYPPETGERVQHPLHGEPVRVSNPGAQRGVVLGDIVGRRGDDTRGRLVVEPRSRPGLRMLLSVANDGLKVTSQCRLDQLLVAESTSAIHGALSLSRCQVIRIYPRSGPGLERRV
jgi:hypothetical protein